MRKGEDDLSDFLIDRISIREQADALLTEEERQIIDAYDQKLDELVEEHKTSLTPELEEDLSKLAFDSVPGSREAYDKLGSIEDMLDLQVNKNHKLQ
jgi:MoxR-like ATPase